MSSEIIPDGVWTVATEFSKLIRDVDKDLIRKKCRSYLASEMSLYKKMKQVKPEDGEMPKAPKPLCKPSANLSDIQKIGHRDAYIAKCEAYMDEASEQVWKITEAQRQIFENHNSDEKEVDKAIALMLRVIQVLSKCKRGKSEFKQLCLILPKPKHEISKLMWELLIIDSWDNELDRIQDAYKITKDNLIIDNYQGNKIDESQVSENLLNAGETGKSTGNCKKYISLRNAAKSHILTPCASFSRQYFLKLQDGIAQRMVDKTIHSVRQQFPSYANSQMPHIPSPDFFNIKSFA